MSSPMRRVALLLLLATFAAGAIWAARTGGITPRGVSEWLGALGPGAPVLFVLAFVLGSAVGLPGMVFVIGATLAFGAWLGLAVGYIGGMLAVTVPFLAARRLRDPATGWQPRNRFLARALALIDRHPFRAVIALRLVLWFNPPLSYALAASAVPLRTYVVACAVALLPVVSVAVVAVSWLV